MTGEGDGRDRTVGVIESLLFLPAIEHTGGGVLATNVQQCTDTVGMTRAPSERASIWASSPAVSSLACLVDESSGCTRGRPGVYDVGVPGTWGTETNVPARAVPSTSPAGNKTFWPWTSVESY